jgi:peptide deformylase
MTAAKESIISLPSAQLRAKSKKVGFIDQKIKQTIEDMAAATLDWEDSREHEVGVALAAIQIDLPLKIVIIRSDFDNKENRTFKVFINPEITKFEGELVEDFEGCLSIRDIYGKVPRYEKVRVKALDIDGNIVRLKTEGFLARVFQHEIDHTNGVVFIDHIKDNQSSFYKLDKEGKLEALDYDKDVRNNRLLW